MRNAPFGIRALAAFFAFGSTMSFLACLGLAFPGGALEPMWRLNPRAHEGLLQLGDWAVGLMAIVSIACAFSALGLLALSRWGYRVALSVLAINLTGDLVNAIAIGDARTLIGVPIAGLLMFYLFRRRGLFAMRHAQRASHP